MVKPRKSGRLEDALNSTTEAMLREAADKFPHRNFQAAWLGISVKKHRYLLEKHKMIWATGSPLYNRKVQMERPWSVELVGIERGYEPGEPAARRSKWVAFYFDAAVDGWPWKRRLRVELEKLPKKYRNKLSGGRIRIVTDEDEVMIKRVWSTSYGYQFE